MTSESVSTSDRAYACWGSDIDASAHDQMAAACALPVTVAGALMPDAHVGYGLPIGGVLATEGVVIPYAVGVDIACRVMVTIFDLKTSALERDVHRFRDVIEKSTLFGVGKGWQASERPDAPVMDEDWSASPITSQRKDLAWKQLGTSGSGNHFVEFGTMSISANASGIPEGEYVAVVSHSGSRGTGAAVCSHYSTIAQDLHADLPKEQRHLAWLGLASQAGGEYWEAMNLMGRYASANHHVIHGKLIKNLGAAVVFQIENHHNFAWKEEHGGREVVVHRKGATPAGAGVLGYVPGSMTAPGYVIEGKGKTESLDSAAHGAGRKMSRTAAKKRETWRELNERLKRKRVELMSAGLDESPIAYKDIKRVMAAQSDLVNAVGEFQPRVVKMAPGGERPED